VKGLPESSIGLGYLAMSGSDQPFYVLPCVQYPFMTAFLELRIQSSLLLLSQDAVVCVCSFDLSNNDNEQY
jgi:hypothetical protein